MKKTVFMIACVGLLAACGGGGKRKEETKKEENLLSQKLQVIRIIKKGLKLVCKE